MPSDRITDAVKTINDELANEVNKAAEFQLPLLREYLKDVREVRMAFASEVREVLRSAQQLKEITKGVVEITTFGDALVKLHDVLTPEFVATLERFAKAKE
jgi:hypothetical protein